MKKILIISIFFFWIGAVSLMSSVFIVKENNKLMEFVGGVPSNSVLQNELRSDGTEFLGDISFSEAVMDLQYVSYHNKKDDCFLVIESKIYDVTSYVPLHPGGSQQILEYCGNDATEAFVTKGDGKKPEDHSDFARELLSQFYIADLGNKVLIKNSDNNIVSLDDVVGGSASSEEGLFLNPVTNIITPNIIPKKDIQIQSDAKNEVQKTGSSGAETIYNAKTVTLHSSSNDCWMIINENVYNLTQYIPFHPGGQNQIIPLCGQDGSNAFNTRGGSGSHSNSARNQLAGYLIAPLNTTTNNNIDTTTDAGTEINNNSSSTHTVSVSNSGSISPSTLNINVGDTVVFTYVGSGDEAKLIFSPTPPSTIKLDHEKTQYTYVFTETGSYSYYVKDRSGTNATIAVE